jgi:methylmalonyl-CoA mutase C-terminal domain/subunit
MAERPLRVLMAKVGLDGHDRGLRVVARILRDAGCEVVYAGLRQSPESIAAMTVQEDVDVVGVSMHNGAHLTLAPAVVLALREAGLSTPVVVGGIVPPADVAVLLSDGVAAVWDAFPSGLPMSLRKHISKDVQLSKDAYVFWKGMRPAGPAVGPEVCVFRNSLTVAVDINDHVERIPRDTRPVATRDNAEPDLQLPTRRTASASSGTASCQSPTRPTSQCSKTGAVGSVLTARMVPAARTPTMWLNFPLSPRAT